MAQPKKKQETKDPTVAEIVVRCLEEEGTKYVFGIPGEENLEFMQALKDSSIRVITTRHEQGAAFMADMHGRLTGKAGVCFSTLGPGATNLITGVADANSDGAPLIAITAQVHTSRLHSTTHQYLDLTNLFAPITKRSKIILHPETANEAIRIAFKYAQREKPGATHVTIPPDVAGMTVTNKAAQLPMAPIPSAPKQAARARVDEAIRLINKSKRPVILAGHSAVRARASKALTLVAEELNIPVINTMMAKGIVPRSLPQHCGTVGIGPHKDYQNKILDEADLIISVGYDIVELAPNKWNNADRSRPIIHLDTKPAHINNSYQATVQVVGDIGETLMKVYRGCETKKDQPRVLKLQEKWKKEHASYLDDASWPPKPQRILADVRRVMGEGDILVSDVGAHKMWIGRQYECDEPNTCIISNGFASMGLGVPGAFAAKLLNPDKRVLTITGDGGFMMNNQEMETAKREGVPFVAMIWNDSSYGLIKWHQENRFGEHNFVDFTNPDYVKMAESMGCKGYRITKPEEIIPTLEKAFEETVPVIIDCPVDYSGNTAHTKRLIEGYDKL
ncbi:MAG: acetolactate synthase large subunit [Actinomycetaceae bacterium]|nr:acetolactate synthase large subunit [Actinomycetaceae bacterium]